MTTRPDESRHSKGQRAQAHRRAARSGVHVEVFSERDLRRVFSSQDLDAKVADGPHLAHNLG